MGCNKKCEEIFKENLDWASNIYERLEKKLSKMTIRSRNKLPDGVDKSGIHIDKYPENKDFWTTGFWGALNLILYNHTKKEDYLLTARRSEELLDELFDDYELLHHDVGFMWHILSGSDYKITGNKEARNTNLWMASLLSSRFVSSKNGGGFIRAWNMSYAEGVKADNLSIIDCMMNIPMLYWASEELNDDRFKRIAVMHADMALRDHIRKDGSVVHMVEHDRETGKCIKTYGGQGYCDGSSWSRGCSWALYGFVLSYKYTKDERYLEAAERVAKHFIKGCQDNEWLPPIDFCAPKEPRYFDSSAGACACSGMIELAKYLGNEKGAEYLFGAVNILKAMTDKFCDFDENNDHILGYGSVFYPFNEKAKAAVHISIIYADYFYTEAILKLIGEDYIPW